MLRSMFTAISGLNNHQARMDVVANNISNINTIGFKRGRVNFQDILNQTISGASPPTATLGGTNPKQIGLGMTVASVDTLFTQGNLQLTGVNTDMAIQGNGMFILEDSNGVSHYTRAGTFTLDANGNLVNRANGYTVQGWQADSTGNINTGAVPSDIVIPTGSTVAPNPTSQIDFDNNLDSSTNGSISLNSQSMVVTDSGTGNTASVTWSLTPTGNFCEWTVTGTLSGGTWASSGTNTLSYTVNVDNDGTHPLGTGTAGEVVFDTAPGATDTINITAGGAATLNLINTSDVLDGTNDDITPVAPDTSDVNIGGTFSAAPAHTASVNVYDSLGNTHAVTFTFTHDNYDPTTGSGNNSWGWAASGPNVTLGDGNLLYTNSGTLSSSTVNNALTLSVPPAATPLVINNLDFSSTNQYAADNTLVVNYQDGYESGSLTSFTVGTSGVVTGIYTNGLTQNLAQLALADFINPGGLLKEGENMFAETGNSGLPQVGTAETGGRGSISPGTLEMSNVDLAQEFVDMITSQRGFQANSRSITTSDEMLQEVINLKR
ncbi:MAG: flagellar hook-basal body complex protein [Candidatus Omnitrophica bacterium]|nr:flagellar hook-basal body complex protein [Candidatus Omnitrophota bacterium]MBD3269140.1 flagellar hook-basal body complex protein [Candidatus Omnitrophota bacterium]